MRRQDCTRYEIAAESQDGRRYLVAYAARKSIAGMVDAVRARADAILAALDLDESCRITQAKGGRLPSAVLEGWTLRFTGRTRLEAIAAPLPYVADVASATT
jgi:hypothetical protein